MRAFTVFLGDVPVGRLSHERERGVSFRFTDDYRRALPRPVLGQKFEDNLSRIYRGRDHALPAFFANLLPEGDLRQLLEQRLNLPEGDDLAFLAAVAQDLPGAVTLQRTSWQPDMANTEPATADDTPTDVDDSQPGGLRFSVAGFQLKLSMLRDADKLVLPVRGQHGRWLIKFDSERFPGLPENEYSMLEWARNAGFEVPECHLHRLRDVVDAPIDELVTGGSVFAIKRYDRTADRRIHQEDFAQVVGLYPKRKYDHRTYEQLAILVRAIAGPDDHERFIRRLVFTVACGNGDAHLKNWSLIYPDGISAHLAPVYDQVATVVWPKLARELALKLAGVKRFSAIDTGTFERLAQRTRSDGISTVVHDTLERLARAWSDIGADLPLWPQHRRALLDHWRQVPLLSQSPLGQL